MSNEFNVNQSIQQAAYDVCPRCKRKTVVHSFMSGEFVIYTHHCKEHGDVVPMRSAVFNDYLIAE